ncbi:MAG TPA: plastocyanin/azurin family copper-binding protein [Candidatus Tumulicola sp.]|jgi:plastocyanin
MKRLAFAVTLATVTGLVAACTPNGLTDTSSGPPPSSGVNHIVNVNLTLNQPVKTPYGASGGMSPPVTIAHVGDTITFENTDGFAHTATSIPNATTFPPSSPFGIQAEKQTGNTVSGGWSSGVMQAGSNSQTVKIDKKGLYLFGCFFHYGAPMRGAIVVQ